MSTPSDKGDVKTAQIYQCLPVAPQEARGPLCSPWGPTYQRASAATSRRLKRQFRSDEAHQPGNQTYEATEKIASPERRHRDSNGLFVPLRAGSSVHRPEKHGAPGKGGLTCLGGPAAGEESARVPSASGSGSIRIYTQETLVQTAGSPRHFAGGSRLLYVS